MKLLGREILHYFKEKYAEARSQIESWEAEVKGSQWNTPHDIRKRYPKASFLKDRQVVFDICWNKYRLLVQVSYKNEIVQIKKIGTHKEYDKWKID
jgi:mRNA interferase HigB